MVLSLDHAFLEELNDYFGELCTDNTYMEPEPLKIENDHMIPEITVSQAWNSLQQRRKTATGPDDIQYTVWRDHGALLAPVITMVWNLSLKTHTWRRAGKKSNIIPLSKVDLLKEKNRLSWHKRYFRHCEGFWRDRVKKAQLSLRIGKGVAVRTSLNLA